LYAKRLLRDEKIIKALLSSSGGILGIGRAFPKEDAREVSVGRNAEGTDLYARKGGPGGTVVDSLGDSEVKQGCRSTKR
jgi:hypothetical protein